MRSQNQFDFRQMRSTNQAVHHLTNHIANNLDEAMYTIGVFLDLAKAFNSISCSIIFNKLEALGIIGTQFRLFSDYLTERT